MVDLPTLEAAEDAAAAAMASLIGIALAGYEGEEVSRRALVEVCRDLLRGPVAEDYSRELGGYCMKAPTDPTLRALGVLGNRLVELSYTARNPHKALAEAASLWVALHREVEDR